MADIRVENPGGRLDPDRVAKLRAVGELITESLASLVCREHGDGIREVTVISQNGVRVVLDVCCEAMGKAANRLLRE